MAKAKKADVDANLRVCVLETHVGEPLIIRANPSEEEVRAFVAEHLRRYHAGEHGGPGGHPAHKILSAAYFESEAAFMAGQGKQAEVAIDDLDPMAAL